MEQIPFSIKIFSNFHKKKEIAIGKTTCINQFPNYPKFVKLFD